METTRTRLRRLRPNDFENMRILESDPAIMRFTPSRVPHSAEQTQARLAAQIEKQRDLEPFGIWVAEGKKSSAFLGWFMLFPAPGGELELGFMIGQAHWGRGYATEVCQALLLFAQSKGAVRLIAKTSPDNSASIRVLEKLGFRYLENILSKEGEALKLFERREA